MAHLPQVMHIKRASWKAKPIHVLMDQIERHPDYPEERLHDAKAQKVEAAKRQPAQEDAYAPVVVEEGYPREKKRRWWQRLFGH